MSSALATSLFRCTHPACACTTASFLPQSTPSGESIRWDCITCGHAFGLHVPASQAHSPAPTTATTTAAATAAKTITTPTKRPLDQTNVQPMSTPLKVSVFSGFSVGNAGEDGDWRRARRIDDRASHQASKRAKRGTSTASRKREGNRRSASGSASASGGGHTGGSGKWSSGLGTHSSLLSGKMKTSQSVSETRLSLAGELEGAVWLDVEGVEAVFFGIAVDDDDDDADSGAAAGDDAAMIDPPATSDNVFVPWLVAQLSQHGLTTSDNNSNPPLWRDTRHAMLPSGFSTPRRPDFCLLPHNHALATAPLRSWRHILVVGEHQSNNSSDTEAFVQLADYAAQVFAHQPMRLVVHGVLSYLAGGVRLFLFDRAGAVGSATLGISAGLLRRLSRMRIVGGSGHPAVRLGGSGHSIVRLEAAGGVAAAAAAMAGGAAAAPMAVQLGATLCRRPGLVCRGTYCAVAQRVTHTAAAAEAHDADGGDDAAILVKFSWRAHARTSEGALLQLAAERGVVGVARYVHHCDLADISTLRAGLGASGRPLRLLTSATPRATSPGSPATPATPPTPATPIRYENRILTCVAMSTIGTRVADLHGNPAALANAILGALVGHASLYFTGGLLHRDVSSSNQCAFRPLPAAMQPQSLRGFLIDLDYAVHFPQPRHPATPPATAAAPHRTGTLAFMSIGILMGEPHTYAHDLESFLYLLIWVCCGCDTMHPCAELRHWEGAAGATDLGVISDVKRGQMLNSKRVETLLDAFTVGAAEAFRHVARCWRDVLFRVETVEGERPLYVHEQRLGGWVKDGLSEMAGYVRMRDALWGVMVEQGWVM
ncbi:hypothetical protein DFH27DRAFT_519568 [Peziza echinospora]|nr:hypothetical protein DFH27DRAFT_519568 [Peziza echinospora]